MPKFRRFQIKILNTTPDFQREVADVDGYRMLIVTDMGKPLPDGKYEQAAYGMVDVLVDTPTFRDEMFRELESMLRTFREQRGA